MNVKKAGKRWFEMKDVRTCWTSKFFMMRFHSWRRCRWPSQSTELPSCLPQIILLSSMATLRSCISIRMICTFCWLETTVMNENNHQQDINVTLYRSCKSVAYLVVLDVWNECSLARYIIVWFMYSSFLRSHNLRSHQINSSSIKQYRQFGMQMDSA